MKLNTKKYFLSLFLLLVVLTLLSAFTLMVILVNRDENFSWFLTIPSFFAVMGIAFYFSMNKLTKSTGKNSFLNYYLVTLFSKFLVSILFVGLYMFLVEEQKIIFIVSFFVYYIVFSVFETKMFLQLNKKSVSENKE